MPDRPFIPARKTMYKGIEMRSRLEATFAGILDEFGVTWSYEGSAFASGKVQYLPDFVIKNPPWLGTYSLCTQWFVEVKPYFSETAMAQMEVIWETFPDAGIALATPEFGMFMPCATREEAFMGMLCRDDSGDGDPGGIVKLSHPRDGEIDFLPALGASIVWSAGRVGWGR